MFHFIPQTETEFRLVVLEYCRGTVAARAAQRGLELPKAFLSTVVHALPGQEWF